jgi:hypothetical protein
MQEPVSKRSLCSVLKLFVQRSIQVIIKIM